MFKSLSLGFTICHMVSFLPPEVTTLYQPTWQQLRPDLLVWYRQEEDARGLSRQRVAAVPFSWEELCKKTSFSQWEARVTSAARWKHQESRIFCSGRRLKDSIRKLRLLWFIPGWPHHRASSRDQPGVEEQWLTAYCCNSVVAACVGRLLGSVVLARN